MSNNFFKNVYDPKVEDIQKVFPDYQPLTREQWKDEYNNYRHETGRTAPEDAEFALKKLNEVTTSYKLSNEQREQLRDLADGKPVNGMQGWDAYCTILSPRQMEYVGW